MLTVAYTKSGVEFPAFFDGTENRILGRIQTDAPKLKVAPFSEYLASINAPVVDVTKLAPYDRYQVNVPVLDQNGLGACCGHSHTTGMEKARDSAGYTYQALSADSLYAQVNGGHDGGSDPADCITAMEQNGICLLSEVPDKWVLWQNIPASAKDNAKRFRIVAAGVYSCKSFAEVVTADSLGFSTTFTINVGNNFGPGSDGVVGFAPGFANHCVAGGEAFRIQNGTPQYRSRNSWGTSWGQNGLFWIEAKHIDNQPGAECYAIMWALEDPQEPNPIPHTLQ
jgi:hypothetical protein